MSDSAIATSSTTPAKAKTKKNRLSGSFFRFVLTRFLLIIPTVFILVTIVFFVMRATGDPISAALGGRAGGSRPPGRPPDPRRTPAAHPRGRL